MRSFLIALSIGAAITAAGPAPAQDAPRPVKLAQIEETEGRTTRQFFGVVTARQTVDLALQVGGQIRDFPVLEGAPVAEGALIAQLDLEPFERALDQARVQKDQADRALARINTLSAGAVSQSSRDDATAAADLADLSVREAEYALENATLIAPFDGLVASRQVANFSTVAAGTPVVRLHDISEWRVEIDVPEVLFRTAGEDPDLILVGKFSGAAREIPLVPREFTAETNAVGQTFKITLAMQEEPGPGVLPGSSITVFARLATQAAQIVVPSSAVVIGDGGETALMIFEPGEGDAGTVRRQPIALEASEDGAFVLADAIAPGTEFVTAGAKALTDGQTVRRFQGFPN